MRWESHQEDEAVMCGEEDLRSDRVHSSTVELKGPTTPTPLD
jgi:hypothetical protein